MEQVQGKKPSNQCWVFPSKFPISLSFSCWYSSKVLPLPDGDFHYFRAVKTAKDDFESFSISDLELLEKQ